MKFLSEERPIFAIHYIFFIRVHVMINKHEEEQSFHRTLEDKTEEVMRAFRTKDQHDEGDRLSFLEETRKVGIISRSGRWLVQNASAGEMVRWPGVRDKDVATLSEGHCLCPECLCTLDEAQESEQAGNAKTWDKNANPGTPESRARIDMS
ncbi:MAG: hypothetical protein ABIK28_22705, partial [Planctomycetota bacterium]